MTTATDLENTIHAALTKVIDPEIGKSITELGMLRSVLVTKNNGHNDVLVEIDLTTSACPMRTEFSRSVEKAVLDIPSIARVDIKFGVMTDEQRTALRKQLRGDLADPTIPFAQPTSRTRVFAIASGKGGVGKSTITANLAAGFTARGLQVGIIDADIYGHSIPDILGSALKPTQVDSMIIPPIAHGIKVISIAQFTRGNSPVLWRGPMLHRALQQFLTDVFWGDIDILLLDLPPGTGDMAISVAQLLPTSELLIVTTPQKASAHVAERAGALAVQTKQKIAGVIENMSALHLPDGSVLDLFGTGGGQMVADKLSHILGVTVPVLGSIPLDSQLRIAGDIGEILDYTIATDTVTAMSSIIDQLIIRKKSIAGMPLGIDTIRN